MLYLWPSVVFFYLCLAECGLYFESLCGPVWPVLSLSGLAVGGFESLPLCSLNILSKYLVLSM